MTTARILSQSGITTDGQPVMAGSFHFVATLGIPLEIVLEFFKARNWAMDWIDYIQGALADGHNPRTISARIISAVGDVYGPVHRNAVATRLDQILPA